MRTTRRLSPLPAAQLLDTHAVGVRREKMYKLDDHIACAVAGITGAWPRELWCAVRVYAVAL
jgi:hypothetical protein